MGSRSAAADPANAGPGVPAPYGRACTNCSKAKCRCVYRGTGPGNGACERCFRLGKPCVPSETVRKRTPRRQIVSRTAQLEEKLDDLVSLLKTQRQGRAEARKDSGPRSAAAAPGAGSEPPRQDHQPTPTKGRQEDNGLLAVFSGPKVAAAAIPSPPSSLGPTDQPSQTPGTAGNAAASVTPSSPLSAAALSPPTTCASELEAEECLEAFRTRFMSFFPFIYIAPSMTAQQFQLERPMTMLAIRCVTSKSLARQQELGDELRALIAQKAVFEHDSSLDILLSILTYVGWGHFHKRDKPYMTVFTRLATAQIMELGLHRPFGDVSSLQCWKHPFPDQMLRRRPTNEERRATLGCYCQCALGLFIMKRFDALRMTTYMEEMMRDLERECEHEGDLVLIALVKINQVIEQLHAARALTCDGTQSRSPPGEPQASSFDCSKALPSYYINLLRAKAKELRASLPDNIRTHDAVEPVLLSLDLMICEAALTKPRPSGQGADPAHSALLAAPQQMDNLHMCVETIDRYFTRLFAIPTVCYHGFSFANCTQTTHALVTLFRLSIYDDPLWDRAALRRRLDLLKLIDMTTEKVMEVQQLVGLESVPDTRRIAGDGGNKGNNNKLRVPNVFSKSWNLLHMLRTSWETELNKLEAAAQNGGVGASAVSAAAASSATSQSSGTSSMVGAASDQLSHQQQQQQQPDLVMNAMDLEQPQPAPFGMYDPFTGVMLPLAPGQSADQAWFPDMFYPWDYQNVGMNWANL